MKSIPPGANLGIREKPTKVAIICERLVRAIASGDARTLTEWATETGTTAADVKLACNRHGLTKAITDHYVKNGAVIKTLRSIRDKNQVELHLGSRAMRLAGLGNAEEVRVEIGGGWIKVSKMEDDHGK